MGSRKGQTLILASLNLFFLFALIGLVADLGYGYFMKMEAQATADAAASAAGVYAMNNGFNCGTGGVACGTAYTCAGVTPHQCAAGGLSLCHGDQRLFGPDGIPDCKQHGHQRRPLAQLYGFRPRSRPRRRTCSSIFRDLKPKTLPPRPRRASSRGRRPLTLCIYVLSSTAQDAFNIGNGARDHIFLRYPGELE